MVHRTTVRPEKAACRHYERARDLSATVRPRQGMTREQRLALYEERASRRLPLFGG